MTLPQVLRAAEPLVDAQGRMTRQWYRAIASLFTSHAATSQAVAKVEQQVTVTTTGGGATVAEGASTLPAIPPKTLLANPTAAEVAPEGIPLGGGLVFLGGALAATAPWTIGDGLSVTSDGVLSVVFPPPPPAGAYAPLVTGELPGPTLVASPDGQCVMVPIS